jgi:hypothetical protein
MGDDASPVVDVKSAPSQAPPSWATTTISPSTTPTDKISNDLAGLSLNIPAGPSMNAPLASYPDPFAALAAPV